MNRHIMEIATFDRERVLYKEGYRHIIGIDEVGRGPLAGPVVAAACTLKDPRALLDNDALQGDVWDFVRDSKKISEKKRDVMYTFVREHFVVGVGCIYPETIDRINILQATFLAMKSAVSALEKELSPITKEVLLIDGSQRIPNISHPQKTITRGDTYVKSIAAASIIAKVTRDRMMVEYDMLFPAYKFGAHKGYGTKVHIEALQKYGATPIHRKSFTPVKKVLQM